MTNSQALYELSPNFKLASEANDVGMGGLRSFDGRAFPLQSVKVRCQIAGPCARTVIEQHFANPYNEVLDATWIFPLPSDGALIALEFLAGDVRVIGECQKREEALAHFEQARADGKRTALLETEQKGVHTLSIAGLPPKSDVIVQLTIVELLPIVDARFRWQFPTTIAPRYTPGNEVAHTGFGRSPDTDLVPNASRLTPPIRLAGGTTLDLEVEIAGSLSSLESSVHAVKLYLDSGSVRIAPSASATLNRDFILEFSVADTTAPVTRAFTDGTYTALIIEPPTTINVRAFPRDAVFVVDISGSMDGSKLTAAKAALTGALHGLN
ncbi:MAG: VIT and VWA domain-containing protein, partial [Gemmatimonadaceae bacterium]